MANLMQLGSDYYATKIAAEATEKGKQLLAQKTEFKKSFLSYLNWGGKYEVVSIETKTPENKALRKMNTWAERQKRLASESSKIWNLVCTFFLKILSCFYTPAFPSEKRNAFQKIYTEIHQSQDSDAKLLQKAREAKHAFKEAYLKAPKQAKMDFCLASATMSWKALWWSYKALE